ncbi:hypothetical protein AB4865_10125 [Capnocytophaga sp. ARDL2]
MIQFHRLGYGGWYEVTPKGFPKAYEFYRQQWEYLMWEYSKMVHYKEEI